MRISVRPEETKILIVEDEFIIAYDMKLVLEDMGVEVTGIARTKEDAIRSIETKQPDLILLDLSLNGEYVGLEFARLNRERWNIPMVFISGHLGDKAVAGVDEMNPVGFIAKPFYPVNLREAVESALESVN